MNDDVFAFAEGYALNVSYHLVGTKYGLFIVRFLKPALLQSPPL